MKDVMYEWFDAEKTKQNVSDLIRKAPFSTYKLHEILAGADTDEAGISLQCVYQWGNPNNKKLPSLAHLVLLASVCNTSLDSIIALKSDASAWCSAGQGNNFD